jgi:PKD repeat protein
MNRLLQLLIVVVFLVLSLNLKSQEQDEPIFPSIIGTGVYHGLTPPLKDLPTISMEEWKEMQMKAEEEGFERNEELQNRSYPYADKALPKGPDQAWQKQMGTTETTKAPILNFSGQTSPYYPSDCNGTVGRNHFMQTINCVYAVYNNTTGALAAGPSNMNTLFSGVTGATYNDGDPLVLYDEQADRWLAVEFSISGSNDYMLVAVSQTNDPTGSWHKYSFDVADMPDYEKFGIWQDGYYMGTNNSSGNDIYVFQRSQMLNGLTAQFVGFNNAWRPTTIDGFMCVPPVDNDGAFAPAGSPGLFITMNDDAIGGGSDQLWIYELAVNWTTPSSSTFNRVQQINVTAFDSNFGNDWYNITQPGTTMQLDAIPQVIMNIPQYRNFGTYQTIVCCHTVDVDATDHAGIRWYELRKTTGTWSVRQTGTYAPDVNSRWMGSIALNGFNEIGLGYSISSSTVYPGIRYCGQSASAYATGAGLLDISEAIIQNATSSQTAYERWGDYSAISIDPDDDHTFWFTTQYGASRQTKIANWQFTPPALTANFSGAPTSICAGGSVTFTDQSVGGPTSWNWSFPGGTPSSFSGQNPPAIVYNTAGIFDVTLTITDATSNDTETKTGYITVNNVIADFSGSPTTVTAGNSVTFTDISFCNPTSWSWSFPGGTPSSATGQGPHIITYYSIGTFDVSLTATKASGSDTKTKTGYINVVNPSYNMANGTITTCSGNFYDSGGPSGNYSNNANLTETFYPSTPGAMIRCVFNSFNTQAGNDILRIYDGINTSATLLGSFSGTSNPGTYTATNGSGALTFNFTSNASTTRAGWDATLSCYSAVPAPIANFSANNTTPAIGQTVAFTDLSTNTPTLWSWSFNPATVTYTGGTSSSSQNPQVQFNGGGLYSVTLVATNGGGSDSEVKANYISVLYPPIANFSANNINPAIGQTVNFADLSTNTPVSWNWVFSQGTITYVDGTNSTSQNPSVQFTAGGNYTVTLTATNASGSDVETKTNYIIVPFLPDADFDADDYDPVIGQTVYFWDASTNYPFSWNWSFIPSTVIYVDGTSSTSMEPDVKFTSGGSYTITMTATNASGSDTETKTNFINVLYPPEANFSASTTTPQIEQAVTFTDLSTNSPYLWTWSFSPTTITYMGGTNSFSQNPQVQFNLVDLYTVTLIATNAGGNDTEIKVDYIDVKSPVINLDITIYLEGPFNGTGMTPYLNGILPLSQPYNISPLNYPGTESVAAIPNANVVDWVLVELRDAADAASATSATMMDRKAAFILNNGKVVGLDGTSILQFNNSLTQQLYVVIWHRNHLGVMSSGFLNDVGGLYSYNFATGANQAIGGSSAHKQIGPGIWGMMSGDGDRDGQVTNSDKSPLWEIEAGSQGYLESDYNLDSQSEDKDKDDFWAPNLGAGSQIPN